MHQVERRRREQLTPAELALLKTCGGAIRRSDRRAHQLARLSAPAERLAVRGYGLKVTAFARDCKMPAVFKAVLRRTSDLIKADLAQLRRRLGHQ